MSDPVPPPPPPPPPPPLYNPTRTRIPASQLAGMLSDVPGSPTNSAYNNYPRHYGARVITSTGTNHPNREYDFREYLGFTATYQGTSYTLPTMSFANMSSSEADLVDTSMALIRYAITQDIAIAGLPVILQTLTDLNARNGNIGSTTQVANSAFTTLLSVFLGGSLNNSEPNIGGQSHGVRRTGDHELETFIASSQLGSTGNQRNVEILGVIFHEVTHGIYGQHPFAHTTNTSLSRLLTPLTLAGVSGEAVYSRGRTFIEVLLSIRDQIKTSTPNGTFTINGRTFDADNLDFTANDARLFFDGPTAARDQGLFGMAYERYENQRRVLLDRKLDRIVRGREALPAGVTIPQLVAIGYLQMKNMPNNLTPAEQEAFRNNVRNYNVRVPGTADLNNDGTTEVGDTGGSSIPTITASPGDFNFEAQVSLFVNAVIEGVTTLDGGRLGMALGSELGRRLTNDPFGQIIASGTLSTVLGALGEAIDKDIFNGTNITTHFLDDGLNSLGKSLLDSIKSAGIGALSSYLTAELIGALGLEGLPGQALNSVGGAVVTQVLTNISQLGSIIPNSGGARVELFTQVNPTLIVSAVGSFLGNKLADEIHTFESVGGQIGAAVGAAYGAFVATKLFEMSVVAAATGNIVTAAALFAAAVAVIVIDKLIGGLIGSIFGGTPRSGADVAWDEQAGFTVTNIYARKGGSKDAAKSLATGVAQNFNAVLAASGSTLLDPQAVQTGNYGMRKSDFVYRPTATRDKDEITARFSGETGASDLVTHGTYLGLADMITQMAGGDVYVKRAIAASLVAAGGNPASNSAGAVGQFDMSTLIGDMSVARDFARYRLASTEINVLLAAAPDTAFSLAWIVTLAHAMELGLNRRGATDWIGGFEVFLDEAADGLVDGRKISAAQVEFGFDGNGGVRYWTAFDAAGEFIGFVDDTVEVDSNTLISGTDASETIVLTHAANAIGRGGNLVLAEGWPDEDDALPQGPATLPGWQNPAGIGETNWIVMGGPDGPETVVIEAGALGLEGGNATNAFAIDGTKAYEFTFHFQYGEGAAAEVAFGLNQLETGAYVIGADGAAQNPFFFAGSEGNEGGFVAGRWYKVVGYVLAQGSALPAAGTLGGVFDTVTGDKVADTNSFAWNPTRPNDDVYARFWGMGGVGETDSTYFSRPEVRAVTESAVLNGADRLASTLGLRIDGMEGDGAALSIDVAATIDAGAGDDIVHGGDMGNNVFGGTGNDTLYGGRLDDWLLGGEGNDTLDAGASAGGLGGNGNYLDGGAGDDTLRGREGSDWLEGGEGADDLDGGGGDDILTGGADGAAAGDLLKGGHGGDQYLIRVGDGADIADEVASGTIVGAPATPGVDRVRARYLGIAGGTIARNWLGDDLDRDVAEAAWEAAGGSGAAPMVAAVAAGGEDAIVMGIGIGIGDIRLSRLGGANGADLLVQVMMLNEAGVEVPSGTQLTVRDWFADPFKRIEWLKFADGTEIRIADVTGFIAGTSGDDVLIGTNGNDFVFGGAGNDQLHLLAGEDVGNGGTGDDLVAGDDGDDLLIGGLGLDRLIGGRGKDSISGDAGNDDLYGGIGNDRLSGGRGNDIVVGGAGDDTFKFARGDGSDVVFDDYSNHWVAIWTSNNVWASGYTRNDTTGEITGPDGSYVRKNMGTVDEPDLQWLGRFDYDHNNGTLYRYDEAAAVASGAPVINAGTDTLEFALGIDIQDIVLTRVSPASNDLVVTVSEENAVLPTYAAGADSITIRNWFAAPGQIEYFAFYQTGQMRVGAGGLNLIAGTDLLNSLTGTVGADWISGGAGDDIVSAGGGDDILSGNTGFDTLKGEAGKDVLYGGSGNDTLDGGDGADLLVGGEGMDTASYATSAVIVRAYLGAAWANAGAAQGDEYSSVENLTGGNYGAGQLLLGSADILGGDAGDNELTGGRGDDTLMGGGGDDSYMWNGSEWADTIREGAFTVQEAVNAAGTLGAGYTVQWTMTDQLQPGYADRYYWRLQVTAPAAGGEPAELVYDWDKFAYPEASPAQPLPTAWDNRGWLGGFAETNGNQVIREKFDTAADGGHDTIEFGTGISLSDLSFERWTDAVRNDSTGVDLVVRYGTGQLDFMRIEDQFTSYGAVESLLFRDGLTVSLANILIGGGTPGTTADELISGLVGIVNETLVGGGGNDWLNGLRGADTLDGGDGNDVLEGGAQADLLDGGANATTGAGWGDTARYVKSSAVNVDLRRTTIQLSGDAQGDILTGIENLVGSATGGDTLSGDDGGNRIDGLDGANLIHGWGGDDVLLGGTGVDNLYGDDGDDALSAADGADMVWGGAGEDTLSGGVGNDTLRGEADDDVLTGGDGDDTLLAGGAGDDDILGEAGNDILAGEDGSDLLVGGAGNDSLQGGAGDDEYYFEAGSGLDTLTDASGVNAILFGDGIAFERLWITQVNQDLRIGVLGTADVLIVTGFFAATGGSEVHAIKTAGHALFVDHPAVLTLIAAMTSASSGTTPAAMPAAVTAMLGSYWHTGGKAVPIGPAGARVIAATEDMAVAVDGNYGVVDQDNNIASYGLDDDAMPGHGTVSSFDPATGAFVYTPDGDFSGVDEFKLLVTDADGQTVAIAIRIEVGSVNDAPVSVDTETGAPLAIAEATSGGQTVAGSTVGRLVATDPEGGTVEWSLVDNGGGRFGITSDGLLHVVAPNLLDREDASSHLVRVRVTDQNGAWVEQDFTVNVLDANEANSFGAIPAMSVAESAALGSAVGTVPAATDIDSGVFGEQRYYFWHNGTASSTSADGLFTIEEQTGQVATAAALDFEAGTPERTYTVVARDNAGASGYNQQTSVLTIAIGDVNDPTSFGPIPAMAVDENVIVGTSVGTVPAATDPDGGLFGQQRYYFWYGNTVHELSSDGRYRINLTTGEIITAVALDFEAGSPSASYQVAVRDNAGQAGYTQSTASVTIGVRDRNEQNALGAIAAMTVDENVTVGTTVGAVPAATDPDGGAFGQQRYHFRYAGGVHELSADGRYRINALTGEITAAAALNFEAGSPSALYEVSVRDNAGQAGYTESTASFTIGINDKNEQISLGAVAAMAVDENVIVGTSVGTVPTATDPDGGTFGQQRYYFRYSGGVHDLSADGRYRINALTGEITTAVALNFEAGSPSALYEVSVRDNAGQAGYTEATASFAISVRDKNEQNALGAIPAMAVDENVAVGTTVGTVPAATDPDGGIFGEQRYYFRHGDAMHALSADGRYRIDELTGEITTAAALNFEAGSPSALYEVAVRDNAGQAGYTQSTASFAIGIRDKNEQNSLGAIPDMAVAENELAGTLVGTVPAATDPDTGDFGQQRYYFWNGSAASATSADGRFIVDGVSGEIRTNAVLDFEAIPAGPLVYTIVARDNLGLAGFTQSQAQVRISVSNVNEAPATPIVSQMPPVAAESTSTWVASFTLSDPDGTVPTLRFTSNPGGRFAIQGNEVRFTGGTTPDFETLYAQSIALGVTAVDSDNDGLWEIALTAAVDATDGVLSSPGSATISVTVEDVNEAPTSLDWAPLVASVVERDNIPATELPRSAIALGTLSVTDPDIGGFTTGTYGFTVADSRFEVVGTTLYLKQGASFDFEAGATAQIVVTATDQTGGPGAHSIVRTVTIAVEDRDDVFEGDGNDNVITGQQNRDLIFGRGGDDTLDGGAGDDDLDGETGADTLRGGDGNDLLLGGDGTDILDGGAGDDVLEGGANDLATRDTLYGGEGDDRLSGNDGDDELSGGFGADRLEGGSGTDTVSYAWLSEGVAATEGVLADLVTPSYNNGAAEYDSYDSIENLRGTEAADQLYGDSIDNRLEGGDGDDFLEGREGGDFLDGGAGNDVIYGGDGQDTLRGGEGNDQLFAESGDDDLDGGAGDDEMTGGNDNDTYIVTRWSGEDKIFNYDPSGLDVDVLGFRRDEGLIEAEDLWFERSGNDMLITVIGTTSSVRIVDWYVNPDPYGQANFQLDFILADVRSSNTINVEGLVELMDGRRPASVAELEELMADPDYYADWATHWDRNDKPVIEMIGPRSTDEDVALNFTVTATDDITPDAALTMSAVVISQTPTMPGATVIDTSNNDWWSFGPSDVDGNRIMTVNPAPQASGTVVIEVTALDAGGRPESQLFTLTVNAAASQPTISAFAGHGTSGLVAGIALDLQIIFPDEDGSEVQEITIAGVPAALSLNHGVRDGAGLYHLTLADLAGLELDAPEGWSQDVTLTATARATENGTSASAVRVATIIVNAPPTGATFTGGVNENAANGSFVGTVVGVDPDANETFKYSFVTNAGGVVQNASGRFALDAITGVVTVANGSWLNYEVDTSHTITVQVEDSFERVVNQVLTINVTNVNEQNALAAIPNMSVNENVTVGTLIGTVPVATDPDSASHIFGQQRYYFGSVGNALSSDGRYRINATTGAITTEVALNFETMAPGGPYTVIAADNQGQAGYTQSTRTVSIAINNVNEQNALAAIPNMSVNENVGIGTVIGTVTQATDPDSSSHAFGQQRYYFGSVGNALSSDGRYRINATTGVITTEVALNFEAMAAGGPYTVIAADNQGQAGYTQSSRTVSIAINNVNEQNALGAIAPMSVNENVGIGTVIGTVTQATDPDSSSHIFGQQRYYFGSVGNALSSDGRYRINATTGVITTEVALNFETMAPGGPYTVVAADNQGLAGYTQSTAQVSIAITNVNEQNALAAIPNMSVNENVGVGTVIGTVPTATDPDSASHIYGQQRYYFGTVGNALSSDGRYRINATTGVITTEVALNFETMSPGGPYTVVAADNQGQAGYTQSSRTVSIAINNVNEQNALGAIAPMSVNENVGIGTVIGTVTQATDPDSASHAFGQQRYYFGSVGNALSSDGRYRINATTGVITTEVALNFETMAAGGPYTVVAADNQGLAGYTQSTAQVSIAINNVNEQNAFGAIAPMSVNENVGVGTVIGTVPVATDPDSSSHIFGQQRYYFGSVGNALSSDGRYRINATTGVITTEVALNFETMAPGGPYTVVAADNQGQAGYTQSTQQVSIAINNVNEQNALGTIPAMSVNENVGIGTVIGTVTQATDPDSASHAFGQQRYYFGSVGNALSSDGRYRINATTGVITTEVALNFETMAPGGPYTVVAADNQGQAGYTQSTAQVSIAINNVNEQNALGTIPAMSVNENVGIGTVIGTVPVATDPDSAGHSFGQQRYYFGSVGNALSSDGRYRINATTGVITTEVALNFETMSPGGPYTVVAADNQGQAGYTQSTQQVSIAINNVNEQNALGAIGAMSVYENVGIGTLVGTLPAATDPDSAGHAFGQQRYYFWYNGAAYEYSADNRYRIDAASGQILTASALNFEAGSTTIAYDVVARDNQGQAGFSQSVSSVTIAVQDVNEAHSLAPVQYDVNESNTPLGPLIPLTATGGATINVRTAMLSDPENRNMTWRFNNGSTVMGPWQLEQDGTLRMVGSTDYEGMTEMYDYVVVGWDQWGEPIYEWSYIGSDPNLAVFNLGVQAVDNETGLVQEATLTLRVTDVNEAPMVSSYSVYSSHGNLYRQSNTEYWVSVERRNGAIVNVYATDPEHQYGFTYAISGLTVTDLNATSGGSSDIDNGYPTISIGANGVISFNVAGDDEWEGGVRIGGVRRTLSAVYDFTLTVTDSGGVSTSTPFKIVFLRRGSSVPPIVLDLDGDGLELVAFDGSTVAFDMDQDGVKDRTGWVGADDGLLALDRNQNGTIDDISEISFVGDSEGADSDLEGLRAFDSNANGFLDAGDARFGEFRVWRDANQDGTSQADELLSLADAGVVSINLSLSLTGEQPGGVDNVIFGTTEYLTSTGVRRQVGDVFFAFDPSHYDDIAAPVVFDYDGDGAGLVSRDASRASFDMNGDGVADRTGWIEAGDALLALDRNNDGKITQISEISFVGDLAGAKTDLEGLVAFDSNGDHVLSALDARFAEFRLWFDNDGNGVQGTGELLSLAAAGIREISLTRTVLPNGAEGGNIVYANSSFTRTDGSTGTLLDAGLGYVSGKPADPAARLNVAAQQLDAKAGKFSLAARGGQLYADRKDAGAMIDPRAGLVGPASLLTFSNMTVGMLSAIIIDLDGDGVEAKKRTSAKARFDMDGNGGADDTGWVGKGDGFLVIDADGDGRISSGAELSLLAEKSGAKSNFDALAALDSNRDGKIDSRDTRFAELKVWADRNGNGVTDAGELTSLADNDIASLSLATQSSEYVQKVGGNLLLSTATFTRSDGSTGTAGDVALAYRPSTGSRLGADSGPLGDRLDALRRALDPTAARRGESGLAGADAEQQADSAGSLARMAAGSAESTGSGGGTASAALSETARLAYLVQQMAGFGAAGGGVETRDRAPASQRYDYFAA